MVLAVGGCWDRELKFFLLLAFCCRFGLVEHPHKLCRRICRLHLSEISLVVEFRYRPSLFRWWLFRLELRPWIKCRVVA